MHSLALALPISGEALLVANLEAHAHAARGSMAPNTERALRDDTALWTAWCMERGLTALPGLPSTMALFIDDLATRRKPASIRRYVSSIGHLHRAAKVENPTTSEEVKLALKRMGRTYGVAQRQAAGITDVSVARMLAAAGTSLRDLRNKAVLTLAYSTFCRISELAALTVADLDIDAEGWGSVTIRFSKTDQTGEGQLRVVAPDALRYLRAWLDAAGISEGPLFRSVRKGGRLTGGLSPKDIPTIYRDMARAAKFTPEEVRAISGHSTRVGACCDATRYRQSLPAIMQAGGWKSSSMPARYAAKLNVRQSAAAQVVADRIAF